MLPADLATNASFLAGQVADIQLLFFESMANQGMSHPLDLALLHELADGHDLTYTVHLPLDLALADDQPLLRQQAVAEIVNLVRDLMPLQPLSFDLHLNRQPGLDLSRWRQRLDGSLALLAAELGDLRGLLAVENIDYPFSQVSDMVLSHGFSVCLDLGHAVRYGDDLTSLFGLMPHVRHIHYHGVNNGRDHQPLSPDHADLTLRLFTELAEANYQGAVTLEVYNEKDLMDSMAELSRLDLMARGEKVLSPMA